MLKQVHCLSPGLKMIYEGIIDYEEASVYCTYHCLLHASLLCFWIHLNFMISSRHFFLPWWILKPLNEVSFLHNTNLNSFPPTP